MSNLIALRSGHIDWYLAFRKDFLSQLKQQALLFDQIGILNLSTVTKNNIFLARMEQIRKQEGSLRLELEWLIENEIIFDLKADIVKEEVFQTELGESLYFKFMAKKEEHKKLLETLDRDHNNKMKVFKLDYEDQINQGLIDHTQLTSRLKEEMDKSTDDIRGMIESQLEMQSIALRILSLSMERTENVIAVTTLPFVDSSLQIPNSRKSNVMQIVIRNLPLPDSVTSWEKVIDYRNDPDSKKNLLALRKWIRKISAEDLALSEVEEEFEWLLNEFQEHMNYHKMKANTETLEVLVKAPLEIIEDLVKLKLSKIPEPFFALKKKQLMLMEAEISAPGKELAYIIKSREAFQSQE